MKNKSGDHFLLKKVFFLLTITSLLNVFSTTPSYTQENHKKVRLVVEKSVGLPRPDDSRAPTMCNRHVLRAFKEKYPWIEIIESGGVASNQSVLGPENGTLMSIAGGIAPDIISVNFKKSDFFIQQGFLQPLDKFIEQMPKEELKERIVPGAIPVVYREGPDGGTKHWWAVPYENWIMGFAYRKDLFYDAGLNPEHPPETWEEYIEYARKIADPEKGIYGTQFTSGGGASWNFYFLLLSAGARFVEQDKTGEWHAVFNTPEAVEAVYFWLRLIQQPFVKNGKTIDGAAFYGTDWYYTKWKTGKMGMLQFYFNAEMIAEVDPQIVGIAPVPKGPTGLRGSELNCSMMGIFSGIKDPDVLDAAWKFVYFWGSPEADKIRTKVYVENGYGNFINPALLRKYGYTEYLKYVPKGWEEKYKEALYNGVPEPYGKNCAEAYGYVSEPLELAILEKLGTKPPEVAKKRIKELLDIAVAKTNEKMIGIIPPKKMAFRRKVALSLAIVIFLTFIFAFIYIMKVFTPEGTKTGWGFKKYWIAYLILVPAVFGMVLWQYVPTIRGTIMAFLDYKVLGGSTFVGLDNFVNVLFNQEFWLTLWHSIYFAGLMLGLGFFSPIFLAIMLHEVPKGKVFFRVIFYLPSVISSIIVVLLWKSFYEPSNNGILNKILTLISGSKILPQDWLQSPNFAMFCVIIPIIWASVGPGCLIYLAALKTIPEDLYEAADIDGSNIWQKLWNVTIPTIKPLITISFVGAFISAFRSVDFILAMTDGGPAGKTNVSELLIFKTAFFNLRFGMATAMSWLIGFILIGFTVYQLRYLTKMQFKTAE
ncbi:MAG: extracellular solute-binding protein [Elusimicrobia bacterium]|nr:extracellular solute-binding protein [Elusimicrobiota bacterium]